jgi:hypothetical protein
VGRLKVMTIQDFKIRIIKFFVKNTQYSHSSNFLEIVDGISSNQELDKKKVEKALNDFVETEILTKLSVKGEDVWVLLKPLHAHSQTISLGMFTSELIHSVIDEFSALEDSKIDEVCLHNITEKDIQNVCLVALKHLELLRKVKEDSDD